MSKIRGQGPLSVGCLLLAAAVSLRQGGITPGQLVLLGTYFTALTGTVITLLNLGPILSKGAESVRSLGEVLQEPDLELNEGKRVVEDVTGRIELQEVVVAYDAKDRPAVAGVSLIIEPGQTVAFVGHSGSGKSTLMNTVLGFVRPTSGRVLLDGQDMQELDLRTVRRYISVVPQESVLFEGSIRENVTYGLGAVDDETVRRALREANATEIVDSLPQGWDTIVGERGSRLSGGQRQRLSIARALIRGPRVLLLDEATSALDSESEAKIQLALEALTRHRTTLVIAHRLSTIRNADRIIVLDHGQIVQQGRHAELIAEPAGQYARLWGIQRGGMALE